LTPFDTPCGPKGLVIANMTFIFIDYDFVAGQIFYDLVGTLFALGDSHRACIAKSPAMKGHSDRKFLF